MREKTLGRAAQAGWILWLILALCLPRAWAEGDGFYTLDGLVSADEDETVVLLLDRTYYSGDTIYRGTTLKPLKGSCALHCAAVVFSNLRGEGISGQQIAAANNRDIRQASSWTPFVSWGKLSSQFGFTVHTTNMAQYGANLKKHGVKTVERRQQKMARLTEIFETSGSGGGLIVHFNSSGQLNGSGAHRHAVVLMGYIVENGQVTDLLVNDSSLPAPQGVCVRMSRSSLPVSILGQRRVDQAAANGDNLAMILKDYAVSCRWASQEE